MKSLITLLIIIVLSAACYGQSKQYTSNGSASYTIISITNLLGVVYLNQWTTAQYDFFIYNKSDTAWLQGSFDSAYTAGNTFDVPPGQWTPYFEYDAKVFRKLYLRRKFNVAGTVDYIFQIKNTSVK